MESMTLYARWDWNGKKYNLWLGTTQVTGENMSDVFGNGKVSFDPYNSRLTFKDNAVSLGTPGTPEELSGKTVLIYSELSNLTIQGTAKPDSYNPAPDICLYSTGTVKVTGDETDITLTGNKNAIYVKNLNMAGGNLTANSLTKNDDDVVYVPKLWISPAAP